MAQQKGGFAERLFLARQFYEGRIRRRTTDAEFASAIGLKPPSMSKWQGREDAPPHETVAQIARALGVDPGWLAYGDASLAPPPGKIVSGYMDADSLVGPISHPSEFRPAQTAEELKAEMERLRVMAEEKGEGSAKRRKRSAS